MWFGLVGRVRGLLVGVLEEHIVIEEFEEVWCYVGLGYERDV